MLPFSGAGILTVVFEPPPGLTLLRIEVEWSSSREETRRRVTAELERAVYPRFAAETGLALPTPVRDSDLKARRFRRWLPRDGVWNGLQPVVEARLDETHPPGSRPYTTVPLTQVAA